MGTKAEDQAKVLADANKNAEAEQRKELEKSILELEAEKKKNTSLNDGFKALIKGNNPLDVAEDVVKDVVPYGNFIIGGAKIAINFLKNVFGSKKKKKKYKGLLPFFCKSSLSIIDRKGNKILKDAISIGLLKLEAPSQAKLDAMAKQAISNPELFIEKYNSAEAKEFNVPVITIPASTNICFSDKSEAKVNTFMYLINFLLGQYYSKKTTMWKGGGKSVTEVKDYKTTMWSYAVPCPTDKNKGWISIESIQLPNGKLCKYEDTCNIKTFIGVDPELWNSRDPRHNVIMTVHNLINNPKKLEKQSKLYDAKGGIFATVQKVDAFGLEESKGYQYIETNITNALNLALGLPSLWLPKIPYLYKGSYENIAPLIELKNLDQAVVAIKDSAKTEVDDIKNSLTNEIIQPTNIIPIDPRVDPAPQGNSALPALPLLVGAFITYQMVK